MNKNSKKTVLILALCIVSGGSLVSLVWSNRQSFGHGVNSADARHRPAVSQAKGMVERFRTELGLTDAQHEPIQAVMMDVEKKMLAIRNDTSLSDDKRRAKMGELLRGASAKIKSHLTPDQQAKYDAIVASGHH